MAHRDNGKLILPVLGLIGLASPICAIMAPTKRFGFEMRTMFWGFHSAKRSKHCGKTIYECGIDR